MEWSPNLAYATGLITTDGNLSGDGRHISFVSKDLEQIENFQQALGLSNKIGTTISGTGSKCYRIQFSDVDFYHWLVSIGLCAAKSSTLGPIVIPIEFFAHFLRGHLDGDGSLYEYNDPRWPTSYLCYTSFVSASQQHIAWLQNTIEMWLNIRGHITKAKNFSVYQLKYAKQESKMLLPALYYPDHGLALSRKKEKALKMLAKI